MKEFFEKKIITAILIIGILLYFLIVNFSIIYKPLKELISESEVNFSNLDNLISEVETLVDDKLYNRDGFINFYGYNQVILNKNEENNFEVVKDKDGYLHYTYFTNRAKDISGYVDAVKKFKEGIKNTNTEVMYLMAPDKYIRGITQFNYGMPYNYANESADEFLKKLGSNDISFYDFRSNLLKWDISNNEYFYKTDHHWRTETIFEAYSEFVKKLSDKYNIESVDYYTDKSNYNFETYKNSFIGSMARKTGIYYAGIDDFTLIYPKYSTDYDFYYRTNDFEHSGKGDFKDVLLSKEMLVESKSISDEVDKYSTYLFGNQGEVHIKNNNNPEGLKVVFIKDSFFVPFCAFFSNIASDIYMLDPRYFDENILEYINNLEDIDIVFVAYNPQSLSEEFFEPLNNT